MRIDIKSWCDFLSKEYLEYLSERHIYIWGAYEEGKHVYDAILFNGGKIRGFIDNDKNKSEYMGLKVIPQEDIPFQKDIYIIVAARRNNEITEFLKQCELQVYKDYIVIDRRKTILNSVNCYMDSEGNVIDSNTYIRDCNVIVEGYGSHLNIGKNVLFGKNCEISMGYNSQIWIGADCSFGDHTEISVWDHSKLIIGNHCTFGKNSLISSDGYVKVGNENWFGFNTYLTSGDQGRIYIGNDCLFSNGIKIRPDAGHTLFDVEEDKDFKELHLNQIRIEDHVWVGLDVIILGDAEIGNGSVVGAGSLIKKIYPGKSVIAGNPARIIRRNILWDKEVNKNFKNRNI